MIRRLILVVSGVAVLVAPQVSLPTRVIGPLAPSSFVADSRHAYIVDLGQLRVWAESDEDGKSALELCENGHALAASHQVHDAIRQEGGGRYSHWGTGVFLSTSDNTDPRTNGRAYTLHIPQTAWNLLPARLGQLPWLRPATSIMALALVLIPWLPIVCLAGTLRARWWRARTVPFLAAAGALCAIALLFRGNAINMLRWPGFLCYCLLATALFLATFIYLFLTWRSEKHYQFRQHLAWPSRLLSATANVLMALLFLAAAAEAAGRAFPARTSMALDPGIVYFWPEWLEARNSLGYADREPGPKRGPRVLLIGDSFTEGAGVRRHERFGNQLEHLLRRDNDAIEVFNGGRCGMDTWAEALVLEKTGDAVQPDVVVVNYVLNDAEGEAPASKEVSKLDDFLTRRLGSYAYFRLMMMKHNHLWGASAVDWWTLPQEQHAADGPGWRRVGAALDRIAKWCDHRNVRKVLVVYPIFFPDADRMRTVMERVVAAARARGFEARHALDDFDGRWGSLTFSPHDSHPSAEAHLIMARKLHEFLGPVVPSYRAARGPQIAQVGTH